MNHGIPWCASTDIQSSSRIELSLSVRSQSDCLGNKSSKWISAKQKNIGKIMSFLVGKWRRFNRNWTCRHLLSSLKAGSTPRPSLFRLFMKKRSGLEHRFGKDHSRTERFNPGQMAAHEGEVGLEASDRVAKLLRAALVITAAAIVAVFSLFMIAEVADVWLMPEVLRGAGLLFVLPLGLLEAVLLMVYANRTDKRRLRLASIVFLIVMIIILALVGYWFWLLQST